MAGKRQTAVDFARTQEVLALAATLDDPVDAEILETGFGPASPLSWSMESARLVQEAQRVERAIEERLRRLEADLERTRDENAVLAASLRAADLLRTNANALVDAAAVQRARDESEMLAQRLRALEPLAEENAAMKAKLEMLEPLGQLLDSVWDDL